MQSRITNRWTGARTSELLIEKLRIAQLRATASTPPINDRELFPTRLRTGVAARRLTTRWSGHRSGAAPHSRAHKAEKRFARHALGGAAQLTIVIPLLCLNSCVGKLHLVLG